MCDEGICGSIEYSLLFSLTLIVVNIFMRTYEKDFPLFASKIDGVTKQFNLSIPAERLEYFEAKAGVEIKILKDYLDKNSFIAYFLGKKNSGKGTYSKMLKEIFGADKQAVGELAAQIRRVKPPEPYKGKGIKYKGEIIRRKLGKAAKAIGGAGPAAGGGGGK